MLNYSAGDLCFSSGGVVAATHVYVVKSILCLVTAGVSAGFCDEAVTSCDAREISGIERRLDLIYFQNLSPTFSPQCPELLVTGCENVISVSI